jgi:hypothetical protein
MTEDSAWIAETLDGFARCGASTRAANQERPVAGSAFDKAITTVDRAGAWTVRPIAMAIKIAGGYLALSESHLRALAMHCRAPRFEDLPARASSRQALEACSFAFRLLDPRLENEERAKRSLEESLYTLEDRSKSLHDAFVRSGHDMPAWDGGDEISALHSTAARLGITLRARPKATAIAYEALPVLPSQHNEATGRVLYRTWSSGVHPDLLPWLGSSMFRSASEEWLWRVPELAGDFPTFVFNVLLVVSAYERVMEALGDGCGWDTALWRQWSVPRRERLLKMSDEAR